MTAPVRTFVLDTSVLLADPNAIDRFDEHNVVVPVAAIAALEAKRSHPELGWAARQALQRIEQLRATHTSLHTANRHGRGTVRIELNNIDTAQLPKGLQLGDNDLRVLAVARNLSTTHPDDSVVLVTKDLTQRLYAALVDVTVEDYLHGQTDTRWSGIVKVADPDACEALRSDGEITASILKDPVANCGVVITGHGKASALGRVIFANQRDTEPIIRLVEHRTPFDLKLRSAPQRFAADLLADDNVGIVSIGGSAGTGKSVLALAAGLEAVLVHGTHQRVVIFRPLLAVGGEDLGYLPGTESEKMNPWAGAVDDALRFVCTPEMAAEVKRRNLVEVLPLTHIRGRSLTNAISIVDEAQNLTREVLATALTRIGTGSRMILTHDVDQRDNLHVGPNDGVASVIESLKGHPLFGHVTLTKTERSPVAELAARALTH